MIVFKLVFHLKMAYHVSEHNTRVQKPEKSTINLHSNHPRNMLHLNFQSRIVACSGFLGTYYSYHDKDSHAIENVWFVVDSKKDLNRNDFKISFNRFIAGENTCLQTPM